MNHFAKLWKRLTAPSVDVQQADTQRQIRLLSSLLLLLMVLGVLFEAISIAQYVPLGPYTGYRTTLFVLVCLGFLYRLSRTKHYLIVAALAVLVYSLAVYYTAFFFGDPQAVFFIVFLVLSTHLVSVFFPVKWVLLTTVIITISIVLTANIVEFNEITGYYIIQSLGFFVVASSLIIVVARHRNLLEIDRQQLLAEAEERYRILVESAYEGICIHMNGHIADANPGFARLFGYNLGELLGKPVLSLVTNVDRSQLPLNTLFNQPTQVTGLKKDHSTFHVELVSKEQTLQQRQVGVLAARDVTQRVRMEAALRREKDFAESLIEAAELIVLVLDTEGCVVHFNSRLEEIAGYQLDEIQGMDWFANFLPRRDQDQARGLFLIALEDIQTQSYISHIITKLGEERKVEWSTKSLKDVNGVIVGTLTVGQDITKRLQTEARAQRLLYQQITVNQLALALGKFRDLEGIYRTIYEHIRTLMDIEAFIISFYEKEQHLIRPGYVLWSGQIFAPSSFSAIRLDAEGQGVQSRVIQTGAPLYLRDYQSAVKGLRSLPQVGNDLATQVQPGTKPRPINSVLFVPMNIGGETLGVLQVQSFNLNAYTQEDIDLLSALANVASIAIQNARLLEDLRRSNVDLEAERALLAERVDDRTAELRAANAELARAARLKDEFMASMSHELRTPLNAILGMSEVLRRELYAPLNERQTKSVRIIEESGRHLLSLINDVLDISKIEAGKVELQITNVSVDKICQASLLFIKRDAHKKNIRVSSTIDKSLTTIPADERRLKQILVNLLSNAVKFTPEDGAVGLDVEAAGSMIHFTVWDTGIGVSLEDQARLFQPFVQLDSSLSRQYTGSGLGLALVHRLTKLHGGIVSLESEGKTGKGSRFSVSLPIPHPALQASDYQQPIRKKRVPRPAPADGLAAAILLLVDDDPANVEVLTAALSAENYEIVIAQDGREAIERAQEVRPDLILMDIQMPGMDGLEATRHLRRDDDPKLAQVPIIALTALAMPEDKERCLTAGANAYLSKPFGLDELLEAVASQLEPNGTPATI